MKTRGKLLFVMMLLTAFGCAEALAKKVVQQEDSVELALKKI